MYDSESDDTLPPGWQPEIYSEDRVGFRNYLNGDFRSTHPLDNIKRILGPTPVGWIKETLTDGSQIFTNYEIGKQSYLDPRLTVPLRKCIYHKSEFVAKFDSLSTAAEVLRHCPLSSKFVIIAGGSRGVGLSALKAIMSKKAIIICLSRYPPNDVVFKYLSQTSIPTPESLFWFCLDLAQLSSVQKFTKLYASLDWPIHALILSAATLPIPPANKNCSLANWPNCFQILCAKVLKVFHYWFGSHENLLSSTRLAVLSTTVDNVELSIQTNFISHVLLLRLLYPILQKTAKSPTRVRVVFVSCEAHRATSINDPKMLYDNMFPSKSVIASLLGRLETYANSKCFQLLFAKALRQQIQRNSHNVGVLVCSPGNLLQTDLYSSAGPSWWWLRLLQWLAIPFSKSTERAAACVVYCAFHPDVDPFALQDHRRSTRCKREKQIFYFNHCSPQMPAKVVFDGGLATSTWQLTNSCLDSLLNLTPWEFI